MEIKDIKKDLKFRQKCGMYGVNWENAMIYDDVILLRTSTMGLYILMDKNYNTFCVDVCDFYKYLDIEEFVKERYYEYSNKKDFCYPFNGLTLKNILDLSNCVLTMDDRDGKVLATIVKGKMYNREKDGFDEYFQMLSYIKFVSDEIKRYFLISFHMKSVGIDMPSVYEYVNLLVDRIDECIDFNIYNNNRADILNISSCLGQDYRELKMSGILDDIVNLLMKEKGYVINSEYDLGIIKVDGLENNIDLSLINKELLQILDDGDMNSVLKNKNNIKKRTK